MPQPIPMLTYWNGRLVETLSHEELLAAFKELASLHTKWMEDRAESSRISFELLQYGRKK